MKHQKMMSLLLAAAISASAVMPASTYAISKGDINNDSVISADDLTLLQNYILGKAEFDKSQSEAADINGDGILDSRDLTLLKRKLKN